MKLRWSLHLPEGQVDSLAVNPGVVLEWRRQKAEQMLKDETQGASEEQSIHKEPFSPMRELRALEPAARWSISERRASSMVHRACPPAASAPAPLLLTHFRAPWRSLKSKLP